VNLSKEISNGEWMAIFPNLTMDLVLVFCNTNNFRPMVDIGQQMTTGIPQEIQTFEVGN
jgi:hypothetical protein